MIESTTAPPIPTGRLDGQRFFRVGGRDFHYVGDERREGYSRTRPEVWLRAVAHARESGTGLIEERTNQRLNDYVGSGVYGLCLLDGEVTSDRLSGKWYVGGSFVVAEWEV